MLTFVAAYLAVWLGLLLYVLRLGAEQRRLSQAVQALQLRVRQSDDREMPLPREAA
jgi:CcmD family protein